MKDESNPYPVLTAVLRMHREHEEKGYIALRPELSLESPGLMPGTETRADFLEHVREIVPWEVPEDIHPEELHWHILLDFAIVFSDAGLEAVQEAIEDELDDLELEAKLAGGFRG